MRLATAERLLQSRRKATINFITSCRKPSCPQDINMSLYFVTVSQKSRSQRSLGQRVPRYQKLVQVP